MKVLVFLGVLIVSAQSYANSGQCAQFSGVWRGQCAMNGQTVPSTLRISQLGCGYITVNGHSMAIGGTYSQYHNIPFLDGNVHAVATTSLWWSPNAASLKYVSDVYVAKEGVGYTYAERRYGKVTVTGGSGAAPHELDSFSRGRYGDAYCKHYRVQ